MAGPRRQGRVDEAPVPRLRSPRVRAPLLRGPVRRGPVRLRHGPRGPLLRVRPARPDRLLLGLLHP
ncbi:MAG: hypothetical protein BGP03_29980 [Pseudonocardia sp. 73-21]|nr:MAG: hypothetical protein BGP03_29980 [Pseudonocardia sp. 73-21]